MIYEMSNMNFKEAATLAAKLWKTATEKEITEKYIPLLDDEYQQVYLYYIKNKAVGFAHVSIRHDYVEGTKTFPVGYLEGIYVSPECRKKHIAKLLLEKGEEWAKIRHCKEFASDCTLDNYISKEVHQKLGFEEANRIIHFKKHL